MTAARRTPQPGSGLGMEVAKWPEADRAAWQAAFAPASPFDVRPNGSGLAPSTRSALETCYARWLIWLRETDPDTLHLPAGERATEERVLAYIHALSEEIALRSLVGYVSRLQRALMLIAPETDWTWMKPIVKRIERRARQKASVKRPFVHSGVLLKFGLELMREVGADTAMAAVARAEAFRDGLAIALLAARPLRRSNFVGLQLGEHVARAQGGWRVSIPAEQTKVKSGPNLEFMVPVPLSEHLDRYLAEHRLVLAGGSGPHAGSPARGPLWLARSGAQWPSDSFADMIARRSLQRFGGRLTPHDFRHAAATTIAEQSPAECRIIRIILGHSTGATAEKHYIHAEQIGAAWRHQKAVQALREMQPAAR